MAACHVVCSADDQQRAQADRRHGRLQLFAIANTAHQLYDSDQKQQRTCDNDGQGDIVQDVAAKLKALPNAARIAVQERLTRLVEQEGFAFCGLRRFGRVHDNSPGT